MICEGLAGLFEVVIGTDMPVCCGFMCPCKSSPLVLPSATQQLVVKNSKLYHWGQNYYIPFFMFWGIIFGNYYRKLYSM